MGITPPSSSVDTVNGLAQAGIDGRQDTIHEGDGSKTKLIEDGIRVNDMSPGGVIEPDDDFDRPRAADPELYSVLSNNPMCRRATPEELARVAVFMASPAASFVTEANWIVDGGPVARHS